ncbi:hypothetical protein UCRPA7_5209 [Phaeoacremonium minimum UCRPA7]|uniref:Uncharacterized protein n=1 Tax=Phaeoacremonium minimum (strain UCR-PA7) TaxID=1286976 RepID=R8BJ15_PHAM7|nr:hypothetical protein UCRPA7_5209 [Phaeoacremonium minimum UCRPA7]EON99247.1 hypothetical protein UCRPA7_5209 [Phaeoacremonium minimum UCRPA7]
MCGILRLNWVCENQSCRRLIESVVLYMVCDEAIEIRKCPHLYPNKVAGMDINKCNLTPHGLCGTDNHSYGTHWIHETQCRICIEQAAQDNNARLKLERESIKKRLELAHPARHYLASMYSNHPLDPLCLMPVYDSTWKPGNRWAPRD